MTDTALQPSPLTRLAIEHAPRSLHVAIPAIGCIGLALYFAGSVAGLIFLASGIGLAWLVALVLWLRHRHMRRQRLLWSGMASLIEHDPVAGFGTDDSGRIRFCNAGARARFPRAAAALLSAVLVDLLAAPQTVIGRMRRRADAEGTACEDVMTAQGRFRIAVHRIDGAGYIWRFDDRSMPENDPFGEIALPMLCVSKANTIVSTNAAMRDLLGGQPATLDRVLAHLPLAPGRMQQLDTASGPIQAQLAVVDGEDGLRQVYVLPGGTADVSWAHFDAIPVPLLKISHAGQILMSNRRAQALLAIDHGATPDFADVVEGLGRPVDEWLRDVSEGRGANATEVVRATRPQQDVYLQVALGRMVEDRDVSLLAVLIDATELKTLEAQFVQSQKMQAIGQLAGGVAHDFNNLLTAISGHCDLLLLRHETGDPSYGDLMQINQNANRAASLVGQLLAFSRKQNMQPEQIDLRDALRDLTHLLNRLVGEKIDLTWRHDPDLPFIRADRRQLEQVLMNLVVNARDAMPDGGRIRVETRTITLTEPQMRDRAQVPAGKYAVLTVEDEGCGIAADKLPKIFEPFFSTKRVGEGTGLGLSMAYGIVKQSGGFIFADSAVGSGTSFTIFFPAHHGMAERQPAPPPRPTISPARQEGGVILLVEDEAPVRAFAARALRLRGHTVLEADCAESALKTLTDTGLDVDLFVTDVVMPGMDGPTWVSKALKQRPGVKVVFVSGYAEDSFSHAQAKIPNSIFLPKPFSLSQLTQTVQNQLG